MSDINPYAAHGQVPAAMAQADARATFLQRTYTLLLAGILTFAFTLYAAGHIEPVRGWAMSLGQAIYGSRWGWLLYIGLFIGGGMAVHSVAERKPINLIAYFAYTFLIGLLFAPLLLLVLEVDPNAVTQAALLTGLIFTGLTAVVFFTGKDFSFMRGILLVSFIALFATGICSMIFGFSLGTWFSGLIVLLFAGYILYDTGQILNHYPVTAHVSAAVVLFTDVVILFKHLVILLMDRD